MVMAKGLFGVGLSAAALYYVKNVAFPGKEAKDMSSEEILARYDAYYGNATEWMGEQPEHDEANNAAATERYFTLITDFFEYGWGDAFHMAPLKPEWSFKRSMAFWEQNFWLVMGVNSRMKVADLGMGIGGPMRRCAEFTGANVTGVTICQHQINRAKTITASLPQYIQDRTTYLLGDYNDLPAEMEPDSYDAAYFMESLSHSEDRASPLAQAVKIVKPGGIVAGWQWMLRPEFDYSNPKHMELKRGMEYGGGLRNLVKPEARHEEYRRAGLVVLESYDMGTDAILRGHLGWWVSLTTGVDLPSRLTSSHYGRKLTMGTVKILETLGLAEKGTLRTAMMLEHCGYSAATAGELGIFTPAWVTISRVPDDKNTADHQLLIDKLQANIALALKQGKKQ
ncbi:S-adenosyl-L-methionine-dependent methyltransferase [Pelagophyceae sp. CCMP2097]|nr:S-adenosyl-L-methionine-dependent methyltransferase [Pelagophyceae sp. CCMP2097]